MSPSLFVLADGLGGILFAASLSFGLWSLLIAIVLEIVVFRLVLRKMSWRIGGLVIASNALSAFVGGLPSTVGKALRRWDVTSDPWMVHLHYWQDFLPVALILFASTCLVEFLCLLPLTRRPWGGVSLHRLIISTIAANIVSYSVLVTAILLRPPRGTGDFEFLADTLWVPSGGRRVWFVDPETSQLSSIALNESDRRTEANERLGRFEWYSEPIRIYAFVPSRSLVLYADAGHEWRLRKNGRERAVGRTLPQSCRMRADVFESLPVVLPEHAVPSSQPQEDLAGVYYSGGVHYYRMHASAGEREVRTHLIWSLDPAQWGVTTTLAGQTLHFGIKHGVAQMFCRDPEVLEAENVVLFRCGGWIMVMDPVHRRVGRLVRGESMVVETPYFSSSSID